MFLTVVSCEIVAINNSQPAVVAQTQGGNG